MNSIKKVRAHLSRGGVLAYATESCYGLGCDPRNYKAVKKILRLKRRPQNKGLILIASDFFQLAPYVAPLSTAEHALLAHHWPGAVTFLLPAAHDVPRWLTGRHATLAVRVTAHPDAANLCHALNMPLVSTSANRSGMRPLATRAACAKSFGNKVWALPGRVGKRKRPSTIIDIKSGKLIRA